MFIPRNAVFPMWFETFFHFAQRISPIQFSTTKAALLGPTFLQILALVMDPGRQYRPYHLLQRHIFPHTLFWIAFSTSILYQLWEPSNCSMEHHHRTTASIGVGVLGSFKWFSMSKQLVESGRLLLDPPFSISDSSINLVFESFMRFSISSLSSLSNCA